MKKHLLLLWLCLAVILPSYGQTTIAKLKYEEAEEAYSNQNYELTLTKINEAEKILGKTNPILLHLKILSQQNLLKETSKTEVRFPEVDELRKNCEFYLKTYETTANIEDKYREVYKISETLTQYPKTKEEFNKYMIGLIDEEIAKLKSLIKVRAFGDSVCQAYKFKPTKRELLSYNTELAAMKLKGYPSVIVGIQTNSYNPEIDYTKVKNSYVKGFAGFIEDESGNVLTCAWYLEDDKAPYDEHQKAFAKIMELIQAKIDKRHWQVLQKTKGELESTSIVISVPYERSENSIEYYIVYKLLKYGSSAYNVRLSIETTKRFANWW